MTGHTQNKYVQLEPGSSQLAYVLWPERYSRDIDQVIADAQDGGGKRQRLEKGHVDEPEEISGGGLHPCVACDRHFIDQTALDGHLKNKIHRRRMKQIRDGQSYSLHLLCTG